MLILEARIPNPTRTQPWLPDTTPVWRHDVRRAKSLLRLPELRDLVLVGRQHSGLSPTDARVGRIQEGAGVMLI